MATSGTEISYGTKANYVLKKDILQYNVHYYKVKSSLSILYEEYEEVL